MLPALRRSALVLAILSPVAMAGAAAPAQSTSDVRRQEIYVSVLDNKGAPVTGLTTTDIAVREDGTVREVLEVKPAEEPLHIALLIDDSAAASEATQQLRDGLAAFLERVRGKAEIALITVGDRPTVLAPYTRDTEQLTQRVRRIFPRTNAGAYLLDAIVDASRGLAKRESPRKVILALTFEGVEYSNLNHQSVLKELQASGAALHAIAIGTPGAAMADEQRNRGVVLSDGTSRTGGRREQVLSNMGIPDALKKAADELINQYVVIYARPDKLVPPEKVAVSSTRPNVTVRARTRAAGR
jgi:VWFA-related protein